MSPRQFAAPCVGNGAVCMWLHAGKPVYVVRRRADLLETVIPFFQQHPLRSSKREDFEKFVRCVELVAGGSNRTPTGLIEIAEIAQTMNRRKPRHDLIRILRGHTPDIQD